MAHSGTARRPTRARCLTTGEATKPLVRAGRLISLDEDASLGWRRVSIDRRVAEY